MLKRVSVGLLAIISFAVFLELGERFEIPGVHSFAPPQKLSSAGP